jgi:hypothetical protein
MNWENSKTGGGGLQWRNENENTVRLSFWKLRFSFDSNATHVPGRNKN